MGGVWGASGRFRLIIEIIGPDLALGKIEDALHGILRRDAVTALIATHGDLTDADLRGDLRKGESCGRSVILEFHATKLTGAVIYVNRFG